MTASCLRLALGIFAVTFLSFLCSPGHTILQSDTQIYIPMLERLVNPAVLEHDIMAVRPHLSFTLYDEAALLLHRITGLGFEPVLIAQQCVYRAVGVLGLYLLVSGMGVSRTMAFTVAALLSTGAAIMGPAVLTVEYEPVPRGFALPFLWLSLGCLARGWRLAAAFAATTAFAFHPPTAIGFCALLAGVLLWQRRYRELAVLAAGPILLVLTIAAGPPAPERSPLFGTIHPVLESLQRMRAPYNWVSIWLPEWAGHYVLMLAILAVSFWRVRRLISPTLQIFFVALPLFGVLSVPVSYVLLERLKWVLMPQFQPGRYLLFVTFFAVLLAAVAAVRAAQERRWAEAVFFAIVPFAVPLENNLLNLLPPAGPLQWQRLALAVAGGMALTLACRWRGAAAGVALLWFPLVPWLGQVRNYAPIHTPELAAVTSWAKLQTPGDAVFQFADFGKRLEPGVFRARAERALYADWKAGGQVNFMEPFAMLWRQRWQDAGGPQPLERYRSLGIDYVVYRAADAPAGAEPVYRNGAYAVYKLR